MREQQNYTAGIYCRLSSEDAANQESMSIATQREMLCDHVKRQGWDIGGVYVDDGYSGVNFQRPDFQRMIADIETGKINLVICKDLSRLGRNYILCGQYTEIYFPERGIRFIALNDGFDSLNTPGSMDITPFKHILNDMYCKDISTKIKSALRTKAHRGEYLGSKDPYGYLRDPNDKNKLIVNRETSPHVVRMFEMCAGGYGAKWIATRFNEEGILSPADYARWRLHDPEKDGVFERRGFWARTAVHKMLGDEIYIGSIVNCRRATPNYRTKKTVKQDKEDWIIVPDMHEPIISRELFDEAQIKLAGRQHLSSTLKHQKEREDIFKGLFRCEACGTTMILHRTGTGYWAYICRKHHAIGKYACSSHYMNYDRFHAAVLADIQKHAVLFAEDTKKAARELAAKIGQEDEKKLAQTKKELAQAQKRLAELNVKLKKSYEDNMSGKLPDHIFRMFITDYDAEKATLKETVRGMERTLEKARNAEADVGRFVTLLQKYAGCETLDRFMLNELIERITIWETPDMGRYRKGKEKIITIYYKFVGALL